MSTDEFEVEVCKKAGVPYEFVFGLGPRDRLLALTLLHVANMLVSVYRTLWNRGE